MDFAVEFGNTFDRTVWESAAFVCTGCMGYVKNFTAQTTVLCMLTAFVVGGASISLHVSLKRTTWLSI